MWFAECNKPDIILGKTYLSWVVSCYHQVFATTFVMQNRFEFPRKLFRVIAFLSTSSAPFDQTLPLCIYTHWAEQLLDTVLHSRGRKQKLVFLKCFSGSRPAGTFSIQRPSWERTQAIGSNLEGAIERGDGRYVEQLRDLSGRLID